MRRRSRHRRSNGSELLIGVALVLVVMSVSAVPSAGSSSLLLPSILMASVVLVVAAAVALFLYQRMLRQRRALRMLELADVDTMSGVAFERFVGELLRSHGFTVRYTPASGDYGVDLIIEKDGIRTAVQAKRYAKPVAQAAIREAVAGINQYRCTQAMVVTNSHFTRAATVLAKSNNCTLINREALAEMLLRMRTSA